VINVERERGEMFKSSLPGLTRQSIIFRKKMDARVKPGHDASTIENPL